MKVKIKKRKIIVIAEKSEKLLVKHENEQLVISAQQAHQL